MGFGATFGRNSTENRSDNFRPDCLQVPNFLSSGADDGEGMLCSALFPLKFTPSGRAPHRSNTVEYPESPKYKGTQSISLSVYWVPEGNLAGNVRAGFRAIFGQTWAPNPSRSTGLVLQCRLHQKSARQSNSKAISWHQTNPARLPSGTQMP